MDSDLWISRLAAAKRHYAHHHQLQGSSSERLGIEEFEMEEEVRQEFPCPYCYEDHDIASLFLHLEKEHPFESKVAVCPICSAKVSKDMLNHIGMQHGHLFKLQRRRRFRRFAIPSSQALPLLRRDLHEAHLQVLLGNGIYRSHNNPGSNLTADSLLSSLIINVPTSESDESAKSSTLIVEDPCNKKDAPLPAWKSSFELSLTYEERERRQKQATIRATFVQDLLLSTLFGD